MPSPPDRERPGNPLEEATTPFPTRMVAGKYRLGRLIGEGGMGAVYEAEHVELAAKVAVKLLNYVVAADRKAAARFRREARAAASMRHDNIVQVTDAGADERGPFIVMELLEGESLSSLLHRERLIELPVALDITTQILGALDVAHAHKVIHRDLKPGNVFLCRHDGALRVKLLDFGISKFFSEFEPPGVTTTGEVIGTPRYMSPEQARGQLDIDGRADLYTAGVMLYLMLCGRHPHSGNTREEVTAAILSGAIVPPREVRPELPAHLEQAIVRAMSVDRELRFPDGRSFAAALRDPAATVTPAVARAPDPTPPPPASRRRFVLGAGVVALVALLAGGGWLLSGHRATVAAGPALRFGITRYARDEAIREQMQPIADYLGARLGREIELVILDYGVDPGARLANGEIDLGALSSYSYVRAKTRDPGLKLLATAVTQTGTSYEGLIMARADSGIHKLEDLKGRAFCWVDERSTSGYLYPRALFRRRGIDPDHAFSMVRFAGTHPAALAALAAGECDGAAVYANILEDAQALGLARDRFVTLDATPRIPYDAYCVTSRLPADVAAGLQEALLALVAGGEVARRVLPARANVRGFARADDEDYDRVRAIIEFLDEPSVGSRKP